MSMQEMLSDRAKVHGDWAENADIAQRIKDALHSGSSWPRMAPYMREACDLIALKLSRLVSGDWTYDDHIRDIAGYAIRAAESLDAAKSKLGSAHKIGGE